MGRWDEFGGGVLTKRFFKPATNKSCANHQLSIGLAGGFLSGDQIRPDKWSHEEWNGWSFEVECPTDINGQNFSCGMVETYTINGKTDELFDKVEFVEISLNKEYLEYHQKKNDHKILFPLSKTFVFDNGNKPIKKDRFYYICLLS